MYLCNIFAFFILVLHIFPSPPFPSFIFSFPSPRKVLDFPSMSFVDYQFLLFFPLVTVLFFWLRPDWRWVWLLAASCWFYMCFVPAYILILAAMIAVDYVAALGMGRCASSPRLKRLCLLLGGGFNIGVLVFYKYWNFLVANWDALASWSGHLPVLPATNVILPIGL